MGSVNRYRSWGRPSAPEPTRVVRLNWRDESLPSDGGPFLPYGNGRSYGDSCLNGGGTLIDIRGLGRFISFDPVSGILRAEAGVLLDDILKRFVPQGWFVPVTPGTRFVTLGGAIANDVHGKNHHRSGSFGHHVRAFELMRSDGTRLTCSSTSNPDWFAATIGGLGLTGVITWAEIALKPIPGPVIDVETTRFSGVDEFLELSRTSHNSHEYTVAWLDGLGSAGVRGLFFRGNHVKTGGRRIAPPRQRPGLPLTPPFSLLPKSGVRLFNNAVYRMPRRERRMQHYEAFFYPLDGVAHWNRLYGRKGFFQYQCVVPAGAADAIRELMAQLARNGEASFLSVLKVFGDHSAAGWLSFPRPGITLALDIPDRGPATRALLDRLDKITREADGAIYPAKDARMSPTMFETGYPNWRRLEQYRDPAFLSDFWRRATGIGHG